ncbi:MAG: hypothetical protein ABIY52_16320 [Gemmatimonadaceae bacterium]
MIELIDLAPDTHVHDAEYQRLLGYPRERALEERALELADDARAWYAMHGKPWVCARQVRTLERRGDSIVVDGVTLTSARVARTLADAGADSAVLVAVSAGPEIEAEAQRRWKDDKPDEYFFLEVLGSAVVEHLVTMTGARLCGIAESAAMAMLPHYSPGYPEWDIADQARLMALLAPALPARVEVMASGMLRPKKSLLALFGMTRETERVRSLRDLVPCENCTLPNCQYRRRAYRGPRRRGEVEAMRPVEAAPSSMVAVEPLDLRATYSVNAKALRRWAAERLVLTHADDGTVHARFRYDGTTCSNMGRALRFDYDVQLGTRDDGYRILSHRCAPSDGDDGHRFMCEYRRNSDELMSAISGESPLSGQPLDDVLTWRRASTGPTCYCEGESRAQKWGVVLETIHYALAQREKSLREGSTLMNVQA